MSEPTPLEVAQAWAEVVDAAIQEHGRAGHMTRLLAEFEQEKAILFGALEV